jgi:fused signal recognition particle receptor
MEMTPPEIAAGLTLVVVSASWWVIRRTLRSVKPVSSARAGPAGTAPAPSARRGIRAALAATGRRFRERVDSAFRGDSVPQVFEALEEALLGADVGTPTTARLLERLRTRFGVTFTPDALRAGLREELRAALGTCAAGTPSARPWVVLVTGVNGVGKTTTIGKLAALHAAAGRKVLLVAADTYRAAAIEQLEVWAERTGAGIVRHGQGADPSAVVFDGMRAASARGVDVVLVDTAGRLHTRAPLMDELRKVRRTIEREVPGAPHEVLLVLDATTGQNALSQARAFVEAAGVTGTIVTKLDGTAKGGVVVAIGQELAIPVQYVGVGEGVGDLRVFDPDDFVEGLLGSE